MKKPVIVLLSTLLLVSITLSAICIVLVKKNITGKESRRVAVQCSQSAIQWKYDNETEWHDLVDIAQLTGAAGPAGQDGKNGTNGKDGIDGINGANGKDGVNGKDGTDGKDGVNGKDGTDGKDGANGKDGIDGKDGINGKDGIDGVDGKDGIDGRTVEVRSTDAYIQWRYDDGAWQNLVALTDITGPSGSTGTDGRTPEFRADNDMLQWRYAGDSIWLNLYDMSTLRGNDGADGKDGINGQDGKDGIDGVDGRDGVDGKDGNTPFIGDNGNWWIAGSDTGVKAQGADGADGQNGENGKDGICSGYFFADCSISGHRLLQNYAVTPYFTQKLNSKDLVSCSQNKVTLKKGHTYMVCLSGSIGVSSNDNNGNLCVVMKDGYDDTTCKNATRIYQYYAPNSKPKVPLYQYSITYNRIYNAKNNDISLTYSFEQENYNTVLDTLSCTYTVIALD